MPKDCERPADFTDEMWAVAMKIVLLPPERQRKVLWDLDRANLRRSA